MERTLIEQCNTFVVGGDYVGIPKAIAFSIMKDLEERNALANITDRHKSMILANWIRNIIEPELKD